MVVEGEWRDGNAYGDPISDVHSVDWYQPYQRVSIFRKDGAWWVVASGTIQIQRKRLEAETVDQAKREGLDLLLICFERALFRVDDLRRLDVESPTGTAS